MQSTPSTQNAQKVNLDDLRKLIDQEMTALIDADRAPSLLYAPAHYVLSAGGKRMRPLLVLLAGNMFGVSFDKLMPAALSVEVFHNFTLVHDDIMDHAEARRGRPAVHIKWDESTAILTGDLLMGLSYDLLAQLDVPNLGIIIRRFHKMVEQLCEGQALDEAFENMPNVTLADYLGMIEGKTGALVEMAFLLGGFIAGATQDQLDVLQQIGWQMGRGFQIQDDLLDLTATDAAWGKTIGGDLIEGKKAYLLLRALEVAGGDDQAFFSNIKENGLAAEFVNNARTKMEKLGILSEASEQIELHYSRALDALNQLPESEARQTLSAIIKKMAARTF